MATDEPDENPVAPLPPHERPWRHPSELARAQRTAASIPPPPLNRIVAGIALGVAAVLSMALVVLVLPRTAGRENLPVAASPASSTLPVATRNAALGVAALDQLGHTYLLPVTVLPTDLFSAESRPSVTDGTTDTMFVSSFRTLDVARRVTLPTPAGSLIPLEVTYHEPLTGLSLLRSRLRVPASRSKVVVASRPITAAGTTMILHGPTEHRVKVGLRITAGTSDSFIPFEVDAVTRSFTDAAPVTDIDGRFAGLFVHRNGAVGVVPVSAIVSFVERALQSPG